MEYKDRKRCGILNLHYIRNSLRCPLQEDKAIKNSPCVGCALFEAYLEFNEKAIEQLKENEL